LESHVVEIHHQPSHEKGKITKIRGKTIRSEIKLLIIKEAATNYTTNQCEDNPISDVATTSALEDSIEIDEKCIVEELPDTVTELNNDQLFEAENSEGLKQESELITSHVKKEEQMTVNDNDNAENSEGLKQESELITSHVKKEEQTTVNDNDNETVTSDETLVTQTYCCPICKMSLSNGSLLSSHIEREHAQIASLSSVDPTEYPALAEFL